MTASAIHPRRGHRESGFTLLETLVALALLSLLTVFLIDGMRLGSRYLQASVSRAEPADAVGTVQDLLRRMLEETYPALAYGNTGTQPVFNGASDGLTFATVIPPQLGRGGYFRVQLYVDRGRLLIRWQPERSQSIGAWGPDARGPYPLLDHVAQVRFRYFGVATPGDSPRWVDQWRSFVRSPLLVQMDVRFTQGQTSVWPSLTASPKVDVDITCTYDPMTHRCQGR